MSEETKKQTILADDDVSRWFENLVRGSRNTGEVYLRRLSLFCEQNTTTPKKLLQLPKKQLEDLVLDHVSTMEKQGKAPGYTEGMVKSVKSWLGYNEIKLARKIKIRNSRETPTLVDEVVPTQEELKRILNYANERARTCIGLVANAGLRLETLGNESGTDGLRISDLPEIVFRGRHVNFGRIPTMVVVRPELSKAGHRYFTFLTKEASEYLAAYLDKRLAAGEKLQPASAVIAVTPGFELKGKGKRNRGSMFITTKNVSRMIREAIRPAFKWRPYVLRAYFDSGLMVAENRGKIGHPYTVFFMGHKGDMSSRYSTHKGRLRDEDVEDMREAFKRSQEYLQSSKTEGTSQEAMVSTFNRQFLTMAGYSEKEIAQFGELSKLSAQDVQDLIQKKSMKALGLNGNGHQKVVPLTSVKNWILEGWEFVQQLPDDEAVVKLPQNA